MSWRGGAWAPKRHGFGFPIDYAKAIAEDEREIAWAERSIERDWYVRTRPYGDPTLGDYEADELWSVALHFSDAWARLGVTAQDVADLAQAIDLDDTARRLHPNLPEPQPGAAGIRRGVAIVAELEALSLGGMRLYRDEVAARLALRKAKARRARHRRNQEKYDHSPTRSLTR